MKHRPCPRDRCKFCGTPHPSDRPPACPSCGQDLRPDASFNVRPDGSPVGVVSARFRRGRFILHKL